ncbi:DUF2635 domain-containing protein [Gluconobacter japonicus]|uniref:DUF2635 domain-containing protein n=1 Tax=Gluconobacter japonicus TaxID=376620 RepID=UPI003D2A704D
MTTVLVRPAAGRLVLSPAGQAVPEKFLINPADPYWARALRDGDVEAADQSDKPVSVVSAPEGSAKSNG